METEHEAAVKTLNELLGLFMRQAAVEGAAHRPALRRSSVPPARTPRRHPGDKSHD